MTEYIKIIHTQGQHTFVFSDDLEEQYDLLDSLCEHSVVALEWHGMREQSTVELFFEVMRILVAKLQFNGDVYVHYSASSALNQKFFFPADVLGASVRVVYVQDTVKY